MTESIAIRNYCDRIYVSCIQHDTYCEYRLPGHGLMWVRSGRLEIESAEDTVVAHAGQFIFWQRDCTSSMKKLSEGAPPFRSIAITLPREQLKEFFRQKVSAGRLRQRPRGIGGTAVLLPGTLKMERVSSTRCCPTASAAQSPR